jgi:hypothetical protein
MSNGIPFNPPMNSNSPPHNFIVNGVERQAIQSIAFNNNTGIIDSFNSNFGSNLSIYNTYLSVVFGIDVLSTNTQIQLPIIIVEKHVEKSIESCSKILQYKTYQSRNDIKYYIFQLLDCQVNFLLNRGTILITTPPRPPPQPPQLHNFIVNNSVIMATDEYMFNGEMIPYVNTSFGSNLPLGYTYLMTAFSSYTLYTQFEII